MPDEHLGDDRHITIYRDAVGSTIVSGDGNKVFIYHYHLDQSAQAKPESLPSQLAPNPYRGLAAFQVEDADIYFGREAQIIRLWNRLRDLQECATQEHPPVRLLPIIGPSGSGKSSLARAGLLPELARHPLPGYQQPRVVVLRPGEMPLEKLAVVLARIATNDFSPVEKAAEFERVLKRKNDQNRSDGLKRIVNTLSDTSPLIVLVDQFEEVYSLCQQPDEQTAFIDTLLDAASSRSSQVSVVLTLRSDFLGETQRHPLLNQIIGSDQCVVVPAMTAAELRRAIAEPAKRAGHSLDDAIVDLLIQQTEGREGALPLLQFALTQIWEGLKAGKPPTDTLKAIGGVGGALAGEAQRIYDSLSNQEKDIARRLFVGLVQLGEGTRDTRRRAPVASLISSRDNLKQVRQVLDRFSDFRARLITLSSANNAEIAEVTHEALLENWQQLTLWLNGKRDLIRQQRKIEAAAEEWDTQKRKRGYLLQGRQLADVNRFRKQQAEQFPLSRKAEDFIRKSLRQRNLSRLWLLGLLVIPALILEFYLREAKIKGYYASFSGSDGLAKRHAVLNLRSGCLKRSTSDWMPEYIMERRFGSCRDLIFQNLRNADLRGLDLSDIELTLADLSGALLNGANLRSALLTANLDSASLFYTDLYGANLTGAKLRHANFSFANLSFANLIDAEGWSDTQLGAAKLCETKLPEGSKLDPNRDCKELGLPEN
jgi:uncharacterized protein YjbI with pentapeptide repeats